MTTRLRTLAEALHATFWVIPVLMTLAAIALSFALVTLDEAVRDPALAQVGWIWHGGPEGARALLSTVASSMITVAGVVFSVTIVALSLASSQFGPRLLRNFMRDTGNQIVLGTFIATFVYCLLVLRTVRGVATQEFVPSIAITGGVALALVSLGVLIYFIHHVSASIQVTHLITVVSRDLLAAIDRLFPETLGHGARDAPRPPNVPPFEDLGREAHPVRAAQGGYVQAIDSDGLMQLAAAHDLMLHVTHRPGHFVVRGTALVTVWCQGGVDEGVAEGVQEAFILGAERTLTQDVEFAVDQLVEVAVRALSPGVNDPFTAMTCIDRLGEALCRLAERVLPSPDRSDEHGTLRVLADPVTFAGLADAAFTQIRQYGRSSAAVTIRLLETLAVVAARTSRPEDRAALHHHALLIARGAQQALPEEWSRQVVDERYRAVERALG
jgi:uncharacterized membrane protein